MPLENDPQMTPVQSQSPIINGKGASSSTDPTYNVRMLMASENTALRELTLAEIRHVNEKVEHVEETQKLHVMYQDKLSVAEAKRIDAIRSVDVAAAATDRERASAQALLLNSQLTTTAESQRALVATTATAQATSQAQITNQFNERIFNLEKTQNTGAGKAAADDPIFATMVKKLDMVVASQNIGTGVKDQSTVSRNIVFAVIGVVFGAGGLCTGFIGVALALYTFFSHLP
jgi:hypothetical protein